MRPHPPLFIFAAPHHHRFRIIQKSIRPSTSRCNLPLQLIHAIFRKLPASSPPHFPLNRRVQLRARPYSGDKVPKVRIPSSSRAPTKSRSKTVPASAFTSFVLLCRAGRNFILRRDPPPPFPSFPESPTRIPPVVPHSLAALSFPRQHFGTSYSNSSPACR